MGYTLQTNIKRNTKNYANFSYFLGGIDVTNQNLDKFTPYIQGVSRLFMHKTPKFMNEEYPSLTKHFKSLIETGYTRIDGISDISVDFVDFEGGFNGDKFSNVSQARDDTDTLTVSLYEQTGSPVREFIETWVTGTRDIRSGIAHYHGALLHSDTVKYGEKYHTAEFMYINLDPTARDIEYACLFAHAFPTKVPKSHLNFEKGNRDNVSMDLDFRVKKYESPAINQIGVYYLAQSFIEYSYLKFTPNKAKNLFVRSTSAATASSMIKKRNYGIGSVIDESTAGYTAGTDVNDMEDATVGTTAHPSEA